mmetsp:Transcript_11683/g.22731  ORF Transcript_11683/g.22731 Transcript_11683/m.22731 type:complete len:133 (-) Transcript_11683:1-399(-)
MLYQVEVPAGLSPGQQFQTRIEDQIMLVTVPEGAYGGTRIQVQAPNSTPPTVTGVPVYSGESSVGAGAHCEHHGVRVVHQQPQIQMVEVEEISPAGWFCLIVGCFACPGLNLLGFCMRERRLVPVPRYYNMP